MSNNSFDKYIVCMIIVFIFIIIFNIMMITQINELTRSVNDLRSSLHTKKATIENDESSANLDSDSTPEECPSMYSGIYQENDTGSHGFSTSSMHAMLLEVKDFLDNHSIAIVGKLHIIVEIEDLGDYKGYGEHWREDERLIQLLVIKSARLIRGTLKFHPDLFKDSSFTQEKYKKLLSMEESIL